MRSRLTSVLGAVAGGVLLSIGLIGLAGRQAAAAASPGASGRAGALPAERRAHYDSLLAKLQRNEPYLIAPREDVVFRVVRQQLGPEASREQVQAAVDQYYKDFQARNHQASRPNPVAQMGRLKQLELAEQQRAEGAAVSTALTGTPQLLTVMMNFSGTETYDTSDPVEFQGVCLTDTTTLPPTYTVTIDGPQFNEIPQPTDNWTPWVDPADSYTNGFTQAYFDLLMFSTTGYTQTMRPELQNPWTGGQGFDFSGVSFRNWYAENSRGVYAPDGEVIEVTIPRPASYFGAGACGEGVTGDSYNGVEWRIAISAALQINAEQPAFDWTAWDQEDVYDYDNDGDFREADGYVDHFFLIEAGQAQGGEYGEFLIWPHSWDVALGTPEGPAANQLGGYQVSNDGPLGGVWILNYTVSDEVGGLGVLVHEYGHDIGLPDNYSYSEIGADPGFWDEMDSGTFGGGLSGMQPVHHTIWDKAEPYLGWNSPVEIDLGTTTAVGAENALEFTIAQQSKPPAGAIDGLRIKLPPLETIASVQPFGSLMWYSDRGDYRDESIARAFTVGAGEDITVTANLAYDIEEDWDYLYWEISSTVTGGWTPVQVYSDSVDITTNTDPNGNNFAGNGITGASDGWITATAPVTAAQLGAGPVSFRFRYQTDAAVQEEGVYLDNILITGSAAGTLVSDDAESGDTWTHQSEGIITDKPWFIFNGAILTEHSYLVEWRNSGEGTGFTGVPEAQAFATAGFDIGLNRMYWIDELDAAGNIAHVDRFFNHTPGMLVWYANNTYADNEIVNYLLDDPSWGAHGRVLLVDANPDPHVVDDAAGTRLLTERRASFDAAFTLDDRPAFDLSSNVLQAPTDTVTTIPAGLADPNFRDRLGSTPGIANGDFIDPGAGVVLPTRDNVPYWAYWDIYGDLGNPGLNAFGVNLTVVDQAPDGAWGRVRFWVDDDTVFLDKRAQPQGVRPSGMTTYTITLKDGSGSRYSDTHYHLFDAVMIDTLPAGVELVPGSLSLTGNGSVFTTTSASDLAAYGLDPSAVAAGSVSIVWTGELGGTRIDRPDVLIEYATTLPVGCASSPLNLLVVQETITDTFRNNGDPFLWPKHDTYTKAGSVCSPVILLPMLIR
ncbi:MAG: immune inhibitor A [Anaerolineales bacterium]|nr:immune inhibitor A [Anaerolineales bacterium]